MRHLGALAAWLMVEGTISGQVFAQAAPTAPPTPPPAAPPAPPAPVAQPTPVATPPAPIAATPAPPAPFRGSLARSLTGEAKSEYDAGRLLYQDGDFAGASLKFQHAYELSSDPRLLWNRAAAEKNLRHYNQVRLLVQRYVLEGGSRISKAERADANALVETIGAFIADVTVSVSEPDATVLVDGQAVGKTPLEEPLKLDMGPHLFVIQKPDFVEVSRSLEIVGGKVEIEAKLVAVKHVGTLRITADTGSTIRVDNKMVGFGQWQGPMPSGTHRVEVSATGKVSYRSEALVTDDQTNLLHVVLQDQPKRPDPSSHIHVPTWLWVGGAAVLATGLGVSSYFLLKPADRGAPSPVDGSLGTVELSLHQR